MDYEEQKTRFILDRNEMLERGNVDEFIEFVHYHNLPTVSKFLSEKYPNVILTNETQRMIYEISMHELIIKSDVSKERIEESCAWLAARGLMDGV